MKSKSKWLFLWFAGSIVCSMASAQTTIKGKVTDSKGNTLEGSSIYLLNTLDGTSANSDGSYSINTSEKGNQTIVVSSVGYETINQSVSIENNAYTFDFKLKEASQQLDEVVISAGTMEATNDRKVAILRPLDIVTTAGAQGDIVGAIQTLPGTAKVGDQTGLFVRGGDASETSAIIDGMTVQNFFTSDVPGIVQRSRFSPFQFKGTSFSSGGYSARYGQALSSILELKTNDMPSKSTMNMSLTLAGLSADATKVFKNNSLELTGNYTNLNPFYGLSNTNFKFYAPPTGVSGSARWVSKNGDKSIFKLLINHAHYSSATQIPNVFSAGELTRFGLRNNNTYSNASYLVNLSPKLYSYSAASFGDNTDNVSFGNIPSATTQWRVQARTEIGYDIGEKSHWLTGAEWQRFNVHQNFDTLRSTFDEMQLAYYSEFEWKPQRWFGLKAGVRADHSRLLEQTAAAPRISSALKVGAHSQVSVAGGMFYQNPNNRYLMSGFKPKFQEAIHYIANYQWITEKQTFRVEGYFKSYNQLVRELNVPYNPNPYRFVAFNTTINNSGNGYARGVDVFWRDKHLVKNLDYWVSYSFLDTRRLFENFLKEATPTFASQHNLNLVAKYFIEKWKVSISGTYSYASGRPYFDPTESNFLGSHTPPYENISLSMSYLTHIKKAFTVIYAGVDNVANRKNIFGYRYSVDGSQRFAIQPALYRSVFIGMNISMSAFNRDKL